MRKEKGSLTAIAMIVIMIVAVTGGYLAIHFVSGVNPPFTVVESQSMQHSDKSQIGIIDTGDLIFVKNPNKINITSYVEGYANGYSAFGDFGDVIIYERPNKNPVIHRAIVWLDYDPSTGKWSAPSLENYPHWSSNGSKDCQNLTSTFQFTIKYQAGYEKENVTINVGDLPCSSGYLTMGDNPENDYFDQAAGIADSLISMDNIRSVAWKEIPWFGALKLYMNGKTANLDSSASNSLPNLGAMFLSVILIIGSIGFVIDEYSLIRIRKEIMQ